MLRRHASKRAQKHLTPELDRLDLRPIEPLDLSAPSVSPFYRQVCSDCGFVILVKGVQFCPRCGTIARLFDRKGKHMKNQSTLEKVKI
jgi:hypothetical protein